MFTLKASSLSVYREEYPNRAENLSRTFGLDVLKEENRLVLGGYLAFSSDGTGTYYSGKKDL